ncbi:MAG: hypothetical protein R3C11_25105 [Planctomycetaceae bacterium]
MPVPDLQAAADRIQFGTVTRVDHEKKQIIVELPGPAPDSATEAE